MMTRLELILDCISKRITVEETQKILTDAGYRALYPRIILDASALYILYHPEREDENQKLIEKYLQIKS